LFCKIIAGTIPADVVHRDDHVVAFRDIAPKAPTHILLVPTTHYANAAELAAEVAVYLIDLLNWTLRRFSWTPPAQP
jgi:histidine triad (HIT) family protein